MSWLDIFRCKPREEERRRRIANAYRPSGGTGGSASNDDWANSPANPASPSGMLLSPVSPIYGGTHSTSGSTFDYGSSHSPCDTNHGHSSSSYDSGSSSSFSDSGSSSSCDGGSSGF